MNSIYNFNTLCEECDFPADDDGAPMLLLCSFCNLSFCNSKASGKIAATHFVQNEAPEWAFSRCGRARASRRHAAA